MKTLEHINTATYYRFFIPEILKNYKKTIYLEADQILQDDVAKLFDVNLKGKSLGVIPQPLYSGNESTDWKNYCKNQLKMEKPNTYFNAGVLVMNLKKLRKTNFTESALKIAQKNNFKYLDQDILNFMFSSDCVYISDAWNVEIFILNEGKYTQKPKLIHFTSYYKPWKKNTPNSNSLMYTNLFWEYAKKTTNYDEIKNFKP